MHRELELWQPACLPRHACRSGKARPTGMLTPLAHPTSSPHWLAPLATALAPAAAAATRCSGRQASGVHPMEGPSPQRAHPSLSVGPQNAAGVEGQHVQGQALGFVGGGKRLDRAAGKGRKRGRGMAEGLRGPLQGCVLCGDQQGRAG